MTYIGKIDKHNKNVQIIEPIIISSLDNKTNIALYAIGHVKKDISKDPLLDLLKNNNIQFAYGEKNEKYINLCVIHHKRYKILYIHVLYHK